MKRLARFLRAVADRLDALPFFDDDDDRMTVAQWAGMVILHAEAVHGCEHMADARRELGMYGPVGEPRA